MKAEDVAAYLQENPQFFEEHADALAEIYIPHPHGGRAIPISERQIITLREKNRQLEAKLRELIQFGEENDAIGEKVHRLVLALLAARSLESLVHVVEFNLREDFAVPHVALRCWGEGAEAASQPAVTAATREFALSLTHPYCGAQAMADTGALFGESQPRLRSFAFVPLREAENVVGLLALASEDAQRFYPEMGTLFLKRIGEVIAAAAMRQLG